MRAILASLLLLCSGSALGAAYSIDSLSGTFHVQRNGVEIFCATEIDPHGDTVNYTGTCPNSPPPIDPFALTVANVSYRQGGTAVNVNVTQFANVFGRASYNQPIQQYPYVNGSTPSIAVGPGRSLDMTIIPPFNPGTLAHQLKSNSYGSTGDKAFKAKVVPITGTWTTPVWPGCEQSGHQFSENAAIVNFRIASRILPDGTPVPLPDANGNPVQPNRSACYLVASTPVRVLAGWLLPTTAGTMTFTWY